jgi:bifunctional aspartate aminotransferase and glutamate/aspartate-prephenate aminotransferase
MRSAIDLVAALVVCGCVSLASAWTTPIQAGKKIHGICRLATTSSSETTAHAASSYMYINPLIDSIKPSKTVEIFSKVKELQSAGIEVTSLCVGEPDYCPDQTVLDAIVQAVKSGDTKYTAVTGTAALRKAISNDLARRKGVTYDPATEIVVGNGAKQSVYQGILAVAGAADEVLVPAPYWPSYPEMVLLAGATPVIVETTAVTGFLMTPTDLRAALEASPNCRLLILCNPSNPTGGVYNHQQLQELCDVLHDYPAVRVLADEIYERLQFTDTPCPSVASLPGMFDRTITINGFSKAHAMTGLRLGYLCAPAPIAAAVTTIQSQLTSCASSLSQAAGVAALLVPDAVLEQNANVMKEKRDFVLQQLRTMPGVKLAVPPDGAFYVLPDVSVYCGKGNDGGDFLDDTQFCLDLLEQQRLALVPGSSFGAPGTVRISYATSLEELATAMQKLRTFLEQRNS